MPQPANQNRHLVTAIPGPQSAALRAREDAHLAPGAQGYALLADEWRKTPALGSASSGV
jgi:hypothetical protein